MIGRAAPDPGTRVLVLAPHTDDAELGAGGTITQWVAAGADVRFLVFSAAEESVPADLPRDVNRTDAVSAAGHVGVAPDQVRVLDYPVRRFDEYRQPILEELIRVRASFEPGVVLGPCSTDRHQDHGVVHLEMMRAFARLTVLGYELPWNTVTFTASAHVEIGDDALAAKIAALAEYRSQEQRTYVAPDFVRSLARTRGVQVGCPLAEAFEVLHWRM